ncbi:hypothetical protein [Pseudomonas sp. NFACC10-1]|uniref:hypothetical protein n=1 Tax=Pseudomonas sp. NFACC10-1 TaxID=1566247 RepID=UPI000909177F|nr:hypothetical protein [Pseudomonas sp. NFACC10-1]SFW65450.1 hypothetical protein SAMN03159505_02536 [Pseudomonas sp. NFACC10-1]
MAFGLRTYGADGALQINENSFTMRVVFTTVVDNSGWTADGAFSGSGYKQWAADGKAGNATACLIPIGSFNENTTQYEAEMLDGVVRVYNYNRGFPAGKVLANASSMRLLVVRFS